jgi:YD repeat-containing protein
LADEAYGRFLSGRAEPLGIAATTAYAYDANGNVTARTDALSKVSTLAYDDADQFTSFENPLEETTAYAYDGNGNQASVTTHKWEAPLGQRATATQKPLTASQPALSPISPVTCHSGAEECTI